MHNIDLLLSFIKEFLETEGNWFENNKFLEKKTTKNYSQMHLASYYVISLTRDIFIFVVECMSVHLKKIAEHKREKNV